MKINYTLTLLSDAEPGTGLGGEIVNQRIPRDLSGKPMIPANHMKGLLREELLQIEEVLNLEGLTTRCLGQPDEKDQNDRYQNEALCRLSDALLQDSSKEFIGYIARTAIDQETGTAKDGSLRTSERIATGTVFQGQLYLPGDGNSQEELAIQAGLLAISAIGSHRNRGVGRVLISLENKKQPGELFRAIGKSQPFQREVKANPDSLTPSNETVPLRLIFKATSPLCVPERPVVTGVIQSGFAIASSSVRGWIVSRIAQEYGDELATAFYESNQLRAWPLLPCGSLDQENYPIPTRVSLTHKIAKLITDGKTLNPEQDVEDKPICEVDPKNLPHNSPLKASDGVLLRFADKSNPRVEIWKSGSMPRALTPHGVHNDPNTPDGRNLYQVESIAPMVWSGTVLLPKNWAALLQQSVQKNPEAAFGRFRSTRGIGTIEIVEETTFLPWSETDHDDIIILQSPIELAPTKSDQTANQEFESLIEKSWSELTARWNVQAVSTNIGLQFGWNRSGKEKMTGQGRRQQAERVVLPGSIFKILAKDGEDLSASERAELRTLLPTLIQRGLGNGIRRGFGAVSVHPGLAQKVFAPENKKEPDRKTKRKPLVDEVVRIWNKGNQEGILPSPSQIAAVAGIAAKSRDEAIGYLGIQMVRLEKIWATWKEVKNDVKGIIENKNYTDEDVQFALKFLADLIKAKGNQKKGNR